jgi:xanthine dehydrogenase accessory factor
LRSSARGILVIASRCKVERLHTAMVLRGIPEERLDVMHAPAGPDIGAVTPAEIALAAIAGLVALRRGHPEVCERLADRGPQQMRDRASGGSAAAASRPTTPSSSRMTGYVNPVCGAVIDAAHALSSLTMAGQTHYFCCQGCRVEFERDPQKYLQIASHMLAPVGETRE